VAWLKSRPEGEKGASENSPVLENVRNTE